MPLSAQEQQAIEAACRYLSAHCPGPLPWGIVGGPTLEDQHRQERSPEVLISNGEIEAAVEVKALIGSEADQMNLASIRSLDRYLKPSCGGHYHLFPCVDFRTPLDMGFAKRLKAEIDRVAPRLRIGEVGPIRIPRRGRLRCYADRKQSHFYCSHNYRFGACLPTDLHGIFWLMDDGEWEHKFLTDRARDDFARALVSACERIRSGGETILAWDEEWELLPTGSDRDGVWICAATDAQDVPSVAVQALGRAVRDGMQKFATRRWAELHVLVIDNRGVLLPAGMAEAIATRLEPADQQVLDLLLLIDRGQTVRRLWPTSSAWPSSSSSNSGVQAS
jgi:hypothetical protein